MRRWQPRPGVPAPGRVALVAVVFVVALLGQVTSSGAQSTDPPTDPSADPTTSVPSTTTTTTQAPTTDPPGTSSTTTTPSTTSSSTTSPSTTAPGAESSPDESAGTEAATSVNEAPEFATNAWSDPWDMSNADDMLVSDQPWTAQNASGAAFKSGFLGFTLNGQCGTPSCLGFLSPLWNGMYPGALKMGRDGIIASNAIDANTYRSLSIRMWIAAPGVRSAGIFWSRGPSANNASQQGGMPISVNSDGKWHTYTFPLVNYAGFNKPIAWSGVINGLRLALNPVNGARSAVYIDWIRLYQANASGQAPAGAVAYTGGGGGAMCTLLEGAQSTDLSALQPGTYEFYGNDACSGAPLDGPVTIEPRPTPIVSSPSLAGGTDYATNFLKNPWDMSGPSDVARTGNVCGASYTRPAGAFSAYNCRVPYTGYVDDPFVNLHVGSGKYAIPSWKYHRLTVTFTYDGAFSLYGGCHGGTIGRLIWLDTVNKGTARATRPFVTYKDRTTFTVDLNQSPFILNDGPRSTWTSFVRPKGQYIKLLRWDAHEDTCARRFRIHDVRLRADDAPAAGKFDIKWRDPRAMPGDKVSIFVRRGGTATWTRITPLAGVANSAGVKSFTWSTGGFTAGAYTVYLHVARGADPSLAGDFLATGPVSIP